MVERNVTNGNGKVKNASDVLIVYLAQFPCWNTRSAGSLDNFLILLIKIQ